MQTASPCWLRRHRVVTFVLQFEHVVPARRAVVYTAARSSTVSRETNEIVAGAKENDYLCLRSHGQRNKYSALLTVLTLLVRRQEGHPACKITGVVICLERGADLHMAQWMPLPLTVSCFSKIQIGFTFLIPAHRGSPGQRAVKRVCVCFIFSCVTSIESGLWILHGVVAFFPFSFCVFFLFFFIPSVL